MPSVFVDFGDDRGWNHGPPLLVAAVANLLERSSPLLPKRSLGITPRNNLAYNCHDRPMALDTISACSLDSPLRDLLPSKQPGQSLTQADWVQGRFGAGLAGGRIPALGKQRNPAPERNEAPSPKDIS